MLGAVHRVLKDWVNGVTSDYAMYWLLSDAKHVTCKHWPLSSTLIVRVAFFSRTLEGRTMRKVAVVHESARSLSWGDRLRQERRSAYSSGCRPPAGAMVAGDRAPAHRDSDLRRPRSTQRVRDQGGRRLPLVENLMPAFATSRGTSSAGATRTRC